jgi:hypothetical protein
VLAADSEEEHMQRRARRFGFIIVVAAALIAATPAMASAATTSGLWNMNEPRGSTVMTDSSGNGLHGTVGSDVRTGVVAAGATGYNFPYLLPNKPPARPQHLVTVPSNAKLNPDAGTYAVTVRYRTTQNFGNILQKGQNATPGGYWKFEQPNGIVACLFKDANGRQKAVRSKIALNDGRWHTVKCERSATAVTMYVDGARHNRLAGTTGTIANSNELAIGGKSRCDQYRTTCDYFVGDIDYVRIDKG